MNIFILDECPVVAAQEHCDLHVNKMAVEITQQCGSAVIRNGATPDMMPLTKKGTPLKGGYHNHPCTRWVGDSRDNFFWAIEHGLALCDEYSKRYGGKTHACESQLEHLLTLAELIPEGPLTPFALAMENVCRPQACHIKDGYLYHATGPTAVQAYRKFYHHKTTRMKVAWEKTRPAPTWWKGTWSAVQ